MRIMHVVSGLQKASGVTTFVEHLVAELRLRGHEVEVVTKETLGEASARLVASCDLVHIHGLWDLWLHNWAKAARSAGVKVVWSPHGMLTPWALRNKWWKKLPALALYQWGDLHHAAMLHVTASSEVADVRRLGLKNPIVEAPLGVSARLCEGVSTSAGKAREIRRRALAENMREKKTPRVVPLPGAVKTVVHHQITAGSNPSDGDSISKWSETCRGGYAQLGDERGAGVEMAVRRTQKTLLFVSRVQRKKGLPHLLLAWSHLSETVRADWRIRIVGPDEDGHMAELKNQAETLGVVGSIDFVGPRYGADLDSEYRSADLFVLPTHSENFGSVVIEALAHGLPVICTKGAPWAELVTHRCGWWVEDSVEALTAALKEGVSLPSETLREMGARGRRLVEEKYTWKAACDAMAEGYRKIVE